MSPSVIGGAAASRPAFAWLAWLACAAIAAACDGASESTTGASSSGTGGSGGAGAGPPTLELVHGAPAAPAREPETSTLAIEGYASAAGSNGALVAIGTTTAVYEATPQGITELEIVGDEPDLPLETGAVRAIAPYEDGVIVAAETALFFTKGQVLQLSMGSAALHPLGISAIGARIGDEDGDGDAEAHLTIVGSEDAYELEGGTLTKWTVDGEAGPPSAAFAQKDRLYLAYGDRVYEVDKAAKTAYPLIFDIGHVTAIACDSLSCEEGSLLYFATDAGLAERGSDGGYSLYTLAAEGDPAAPVTAFAFDASKQRLYAAAGDRVLRVHAGAVPEAVATLPAGEFPRHMAFDKLGDLWVGVGLEARTFALGTPLSFEADVAPIVHEYCSLCHAEGKNGAPPIDFESYDVMVALVDLVLMRISDGSMPPPGYQKVPKDKIQLLQDWAPTKAP